MNKNIKFYIVTFSLFCFSCFAQNQKNNDHFFINPYINSFIENLVDKDVNLQKHHVALTYLKNDNGDYNIDFELASGYLKTVRKTYFREIKIRYGNIEVVLVARTDEDLNFLNKLIKKTKKSFKNKDSTKDDHSFYDEDYVWTSFFNNKGELLSLYIPEEQEPAFNMYDKLKNKIKISPNFRGVDFNNF